MIIKPGAVIVVHSRFTDKSKRYLYCGNIKIDLRKYRLLYCITGCGGYLVVENDWCKKSRAKIENSSYPEMAEKRRRRFNEKYTNEQKKAMKRY